MIYKSCGLRVQVNPMDIYGLSVWAYETHPSTIILTAFALQPDTVIKWRYAEQELNGL